MHNEYLAIAGDTRKNFNHKDCETCKTVTLFHGWKCTACGTFKVRIRRSGTPSKHKRIKYKLINRQRTNDKRAAFKRQAEESRKKFEGGA